MSENQEVEGSKMGRPKAGHGLKRTSALLDPEQMHRLKILAAKQHRYIYELMVDALEEFLNKHEAK